MHRASRSAFVCGRLIVANGSLAELQSGIYALLPSTQLFTRTRSVLQTRTFSNLSNQNSRSDLDAPPKPHFTQLLSLRTFSASADFAESLAEPNCWQCGAHMNKKHNFFCAGCGKIQPLVNDSDYFTIFSYPAPSFEIDLQDLESRYKGLQVKLHPDRYATMSPQEQEHSANQAAAVNQAYEILRQPLKRAQYLLTLRGMGACESFTVTDPELLEPIMEAREEVDAAEGPEELQKILKKVSAQEEQSIQEIADAFQAGDYDRASELTILLRYINRTKQAIIDKM